MTDFADHRAIVLRHFGIPDHEHAAHFRVDRFADPNAVRSKYEQVYRSLDYYERMRARRKVQ